VARAPGSATRGREGLDKLVDARLDWRPSGVASLTAGHCRPTGLGLAGPSQEGVRIAAPFCFSPFGASTGSTRAPRCTPIPSSPDGLSRRPRRACEAWRCRVPPRRPGPSRGEVVPQWARRGRVAIRGSADWISETPWEVLRRRAFTAPPGAGAGSKAPCLPDATGEAGRLSRCARDLFDNSGLGRGTAQSAWGPAGAGSARPGERDSRCRASSPPRAGLSRAAPMNRWM
jgi:hypothetical protein